MVAFSALTLFLLDLSAREAIHYEFCPSVLALWEVLGCTQALSWDPQCPQGPANSLTP
jgi:hypothetical protein